MRKSAVEVDSLLRAGEAIDAVHAQVAGFLRTGRTEREVGAPTSRTPSWPPDTNGSTS